MQPVVQYHCIYAVICIIYGSIYATVHIQYSTICVFKNTIDSEWAAHMQSIGLEDGTSALPSERIHADSHGCTVLVQLWMCSSEDHPPINLPALNHVTAAALGCANDNISETIWGCAVEKRRSRRAVDVSMATAAARIRRNPAQGVVPPRTIWMSPLYSLREPCSSIPICVSSTLSQALLTSESFALMMRAFDW